MIGRRRAAAGLFGVGLAAALATGVVGAGGESPPVRAQAAASPDARAQATASQATSSPAATAELRSPDAFTSIADRSQRSIALFVEAGKVFQHPRCRNCHPSGDFPLQGEEGRPHHPMVRRGSDGLGVPGLRCTTCHPEANYDAVGVPGQPGWHLAPASMGLQGRRLAELCAQLKDQDRNGGRTVGDIVQHVTKDPLVLWAWDPGGGRRPVPGTAATFAALIAAWADTGAECPRL